jgi:pimeloyl-ACP methyl ester carboxylesterase
MRIIRRFTRTTAIVTAVTLGVVGLSVAGTAISSAQTTTKPAQTRSAPKPTVVLVHGAWADGSSWSAVTSRLQHEGYTVDVEANPLRGVESDAQYLKDYLAVISGPIVLVGHSYGGMVITAAATGNPNVKALVYVDAYIPEDGDTVESLTGAQPGSELNPNTSVNIVPLHDLNGNLIGADVYVKPALFPAIFAAGIPARKAAELAADQRPLAASALSDVFSGVPAWTTIPSWDLIGTADKLLPPAEQVIMATRAHAHIVKINAPHLSMVADPQAVTNLITTAAGCS